MKATAYLKNVGVACGVMLTTAAIGDQSPNRLGLPPIQAPMGSSTTLSRLELGKRLFFDKKLSADGTINCASCHQPEHAFSDGNSIGSLTFALSLAP
jgi:cytochrome c peroxidase